ncbi:hypothetical protein [Salinicola aestuarinus]|uniref:hypothetical protein n=1 Tax=Salinicola aestuarinus TaxID=1949082 RepID=UPI000DA20F9B|nr:hypothetical protein [Salinicola aestuarinus]
MRFDHVKVVDVVEQDSRNASVYSEGSGRYFEIKTEHTGGVTTKVLLENQKTGSQRTWSLSDTNLSFWPGHELIMAYDDQGLVMFYNKSTAEIVRMRVETGNDGNLTGTVILCALWVAFSVMLPIFGLLGFLSAEKKSGNGPVVDKLNRIISYYVGWISVAICYAYYEYGMKAGFGYSVLAVIPATIVALVIGFKVTRGGNSYISNIEKEMLKQANT